MSQSQPKFTFPIPTPSQLIPAYQPKPRAEGAWLLLTTNNSTGWIYTANPHLFRQGRFNQLNAPFYITPAHMRID